MLLHPAVPASFKVGDFLNVLEYLLTSPRGLHRTFNVQLSFMCLLEKVMNLVKRKKCQEGVFLALKMSSIFLTMKVLGEADVHKLWVQRRHYFFSFHYGFLDVPWLNCILNVYCLLWTICPAAMLGPISLEKDFNPNETTLVK